MQEGAQKPAEATSAAAQGAVDHEHEDASPRQIALVGLSVLVMLIVTYLVVFGLFNLFSARQTRADVTPPSLATTPQPPPEPRLQVVPPEALQQYRSEQQELLTTYGWVDESAGTVRIPIDRAMELLVERGLPVFESAPGAQGQQEGTDQSHDLESEGGQPVEATTEPAP